MVKRYHLCDTQFGCPPTVKPYHLCDTTAQPTLGDGAPQPLLTHYHRSAAAAPPAKSYRLLRVFPTRPIHTARRDCTARM
eukprot:SAG11_NODE_3427_length_2454_cov_9.902335_3_plen_80_part_00